MRLLLTIKVFFLLTIHLYGQETARFTSDVSSIENITSAILESISGGTGEKRDWARFRNLFWPTAQLNAIFHKGDSTWIKINAVEEFISLAGTWYEDNGFREYEYKKKIERFGNIAHVFQSYGASLNDGQEIERGMNSYQLAYINDRWWIVNLLWESETAINKLSEDFLK